MIYFICGCSSKLEPPIDREIFNTFDSVVEDWQGHLICLIHKERLRGWRSVPYTANSMPPGVETSSWTPLEFERWKIWGEFPHFRPITLNPAVEDRRDNRDPEEVGKEYLAAMAVARNGNLSMDAEQSLPPNEIPRP